jgi:integrase
MMYRFIGRDKVEWSFNYKGRRIRRREAASHDRKGKAFLDKKAAEIKQAIAFGTFTEAAFFDVVGVPMTVREGIKAYQERYNSIMAKSTAQKYDVAARLVDRHLGRYRLDEITRRHLREFVNALDVKDKTKANYLNVIRKVMSRAVEDGVITDDPCTGFKVNPDKARDGFRRVTRGDVFTPEELGRICEAGDPIWQFWAWTGLRVGELIAMTWEDVDFERGLIHIRRARVYGKDKTTKTVAGTRKIQILPPARESLLEQRSVSALARASVWGYRDQGGHWKAFNWTQQLRDRFLTVTTKAGVRPLPPKQLRHTFASLMLNAGEDPYWLAKTMGHTNPSLTMTVYADFMPDVHQDKGLKAVQRFHMMEER